MQLLYAVTFIDAEVLMPLQRTENCGVALEPKQKATIVDPCCRNLQHRVCVRTPGQNSNAVAELVFGLLVYAVRNFSIMEHQN